MLDIALAIAVLALVAVTAWLLLERRHARRQPAGQPIPDLRLGTTATTGEAPAVVRSEPKPPRDFMLASSIPGGTRELQLQVLEHPDKSLFAKANASATHGPASPALQPLLSGLPQINSLVRGGTVVRILNPQLLNVGEMTPTAEGLIGTVRDVGGKDFVGQLRFADPQNLAVVAAPAVAFVALSAVTGQYYLNRINKQLGAIEQGVDDIEQSLRNAVYGDVIASSESCRDLERALQRTGALRPSDRIKLDAAESRVDSAYHRLEKELFDFRDQIDALADRDRRRRERKSIAREALENARGKRLYDVQLFVLACGVRHKINLLNVVLAEIEADPARLDLAVDKVNEEQQQMTQSLHELQLAFAQLERRSERLDDELRWGLLDEAQLSSQLKTVRGTTNALRRSQSAMLPAAPRVPAYLDARLADDGSWTVAIPAETAHIEARSELLGSLDTSLRAELARRTREQWGGHP